MAAKLKRAEGDVRRVSVLDERARLVEIEDTDQVEDLEEGASLVVEFAAPASSK